MMKNSKILKSTNRMNFFKFKSYNQGKLLKTKKLKLEQIPYSSSGSEESIVLQDDELEFKYTKQNNKIIKQLLDRRIESETEELDYPNSETDEKAFDYFIKHDQSSRIKPILPPILKKKFLDQMDELMERPTELGLDEEIKFSIIYFNYCHHLDKNNNHIDLKKMFVFLKKFPEIEPFSEVPRYLLELPKLIINGPKYEKDSLDTMKTMNREDFSIMLRNLKHNQLYRQRELSSSADYVLKLKLTETQKSLYLLFQIKRSINVDIKTEFQRTFVNRDIFNDKDSILRLIIFNSKETDELTFSFRERYKIFKYDNKENLKQLTSLECEKLNELEHKVLIYYVSPTEYFKFSCYLDI